MKIVELQDQGQDFTELYVNEAGEIIDARPFQRWLWKGHVIAQKHIRRGMRLRLAKPGLNPMILKYPVVSVRTVG